LLSWYGEPPSTLVVNAVEEGILNYKFPLQSQIVRNSDLLVCVAMMKVLATVPAKVFSIWEFFRFKILPLHTACAFPLQASLELSYEFPSLPSSFPSSIIKVSATFSSQPDLVTLAR